jgi:broad specificity phosphatase PhoE
MTELVIVRHAQSEWNAVGRWQGWADPPLSELGVRQARTAGRGLLTSVGEPGPPGLLASSDLRRARRTVELLGAALEEGGADGRPPELLVDPDLREYDAGDWTGLRRVDIEARWPAELAAWDAGRLDRPPGGEDVSVFAARLLAAVERIRRIGIDGWVLAVSHGRAVHALATALGAPGGHVDHLTGWRVRLGSPLTIVGPVALLDAQEDQVAPRRATQEL